MTDETPETPEIETDATEEQEPERIELERCDVNFMVNVTNVKTLDEALDVAAVNLGRYGMDAFYVLATDPDTGRQWIVRDGKIFEADDLQADEASGGE